jgi:hypothetical protein
VAGFVDSVLSNVTVFRCSDVAFSNSKGGERDQDLRNCLVHACPSPQLLPAIIISTASCHAHTIQNSLNVRLTFSMKYIWTMPRSQVFNQAGPVNVGAQFRHSLTRYPHTRNRRLAERNQLTTDKAMSQKWYFLTRTKSSCSASSVT